jgi:hypothetical protein
MNAFFLYSAIIKYMKKYISLFIFIIILLSSGQAFAQSYVNTVPIDIDIETKIIDGKEVNIFKLVPSSMDIKKQKEYFKKFETKGIITKTLKEGMNDPQVKKLEEVLSQTYITYTVVDEYVTNEKIGITNPDKIFDKETTNLVKELQRSFQKVLDLKTDGVVDKKTRSLINGISDYFSKAKEKAKNELIKSTLSSMRAEGELYAINNSDSYGPVFNTASCPKIPNETNMFNTKKEKYGMFELLQVVQKTSPKEVICSATNTEWAVSASLITNGYYCTDSTGNIKETKKPITGPVCK